MTYITENFSINDTGNFSVSMIDVDMVKIMLMRHGFVSAVSSQKTAEVLTDMLKIYIPQDRKEIVMKHGDKVVLFLKKNRIFLLIERTE